MSRRRSMTIYAETLEDFTRTAISWAPHPVFPSPMSYTCRAKTLQITTLCPPKSYNPDSSQRFERPWPQSVNQNWLEFDYDSNESSPEQSVSHNDSIYDGLGVSRSTNEIPPCLLQLCKSRKIMVVGCRGTSRHNLINSLFGDNRDDDLTPSCQTMDLVLKTEETETQQIKYQFWIRTLSNPRLDSLVRLYHKRMDLFVFVYSTSSRTSFEALDKAIQSVLEDVASDKFKGVLIGVQTASEEEQVSYAEGVALKIKYGLELFLETTVYDDWQLKDKILSVIKD